MTDFLLDIMKVIISALVGGAITYIFRQIPKNSKDINVLFRKVRELESLEGDSNERDKIVSSRKSI